VSALAVIVTVAMAAPVLRAPSERVFGMEIVGRHYDPFTVMEQFGRPVALGIYSQPVTDLSGALLARASGPVAAYNWLVLLTFPLSAATAYLLARHVAISPAAAGVAAFAFAFSPFHLAHAAYHPHIAQTQWVPLYFLALWRCLDRSSPAAIGLLALSIVGVTLSNFYGGLIAAVISPAAVAAYWFFKSPREPRSIGRLAITAGTLGVVAAVGAAYVWSAAHAVVLDRAAFAFPRDDLFRYSATWWSYLVPPVAHPLLGGLARRTWNDAGMSPGMLEQQVSLGWGLIALGLVAMFAWRFADRQQRALAAVPILVAVAVVAFTCSLSPEGALGSFRFSRPSALLYGVVPMFRAYARFGVVVQLMAALLAGIGAERLWSSGRLSVRIAYLALLAVASAEYMVSPGALSRDVLPTMAHRWVARQPDRIHVLDCAPLTIESMSIQWLTAYRVTLNSGPVGNCTESNLADKLSVAGYTHLLVRLDTPEGRWFSTRNTPEGLQVAARFDDSEVFAVTAQIRTVHAAQEIP
jgi:hypothetical protein